MHPASKQQLQSELRPARISGRQNPAETGRSDEAIGQIEIRAVEQIVNLGTELQREAFAQARVLNERDVNRGRSGTGENVAAGVSERAITGRREGGGIEPAVRGAVGKFGIRNDIRPVDYGIADTWNACITVIHSWQ